NGYGLYDMSGNVFEWCWDWYKNSTPAGGQDPTGAESGNMRVMRGGSYNNYSSTHNIHRAYRASVKPYENYSIGGLRVACRP
ncbi:SUMF1/EgtB/PvdO family nonheme iron enzyme, partial [Treponema lecithinolyticum]|uniref:formylglycine-generating enzyme family protein n=1 Tax=Treponema lecithinolyticum TaxID=53418 RepID=UPI0028EE3B00